LLSSLSLLFYVPSILLWHSICQEKLCIEVSIYQLNSIGEEGKWIMSKQLLQWVLTACLVLLWAMPGQTQDKADVTAELSVFKVLHQDGKEVLEPTDRVKPGDLVEYKAIYHNKGKSSAKNVLATLPIPEGMEYQANTAAPQQVQASTDGTVFAPVPLRRAMPVAGGKAEVREVPYTEYRFLRWALGELAAGKQKTVSARVQVSAAAAAPVPAERR
jgi:uncharacterized repeat protein (TIGR01451 family)